MTYYYYRKEEAIEAGKEMFGEEWCVNAQMEPGNGWVIVLSPKGLDYLKKPLEPILEFAEIQILHTVRRRPASFKPLPAMERKSAPAPRIRKPVKAPPPPPVRAEAPVAVPTAPPPPPPVRKP